MAKLKLVESDFRKTSAFKWTPDRAEAAMLLAEGYTHQQVGDSVGKTDRTIRLWLAEMEFSAEVDRLSVMVGIASRAERLRLAKRVIRQQEKGELLTTDKDLLDWLKYAQSETDGIKLNLAALDSALGQDDASMADSGSDGTRKAKTA